MSSKNSWIPVDEIGLNDVVVIREGDNRKVAIIKECSKANDKYLVVKLQYEHREWVSKSDMFQASEEQIEKGKEWNRKKVEAWNDRISPPPFGYCCNPECRSGMETSDDVGAYQEVVSDDRDGFRRLRICIACVRNGVSIGKVLNKRDSRRKWRRRSDSH